MVTINGLFVTVSHTIFLLRLAHQLLHTQVISYENVHHSEVVVATHFQLQSLLHNTRSTRSVAQVCLPGSRKIDIILRHVGRPAIPSRTLLLL
jgi:hypothetical protein